MADKTWTYLSTYFKVICPNIVLKQFFLFFCWTVPLRHMLAFTISYQHLTSLKLIKVCCENIGLRYWSNACGWYWILSLYHKFTLITVRSCYCVLRLEWMLTRVAIQYLSLAHSKMNAQGFRSSGLYWVLPIVFFYIILIRRNTNQYNSRKEAYANYLWGKCCC